MNNVFFKITVPSDNDGFITIQCPFCNDRFKLTVEDFKREDIIEIFCPYCGLRDEPSHFYTDEIVEQAQVVARNYTKSLLSQSSKDLEKTFKGKKHISFKAGKPIKMESEKILFEHEELEVTNLDCCQFIVKTRALSKEIGIYCPCCGVR
ncbi:TFIIB-type zinc ribbon-containing protein [Microcoleus sp. FACHB-68]|uniref:TFIIB-type zinc ribbon-containing protein n=1 Tax=Microcoleus sp. FACHB-68 TaxID=2692826 RepID=UPI001682D4D4|nr:TFIIB-type zinc ribbon-containing protein [Microcoleus sp. FACHB-68]MBD1939647.1 TFIIB-type zinc ribbon-containing protein [Microcoleus sp. FACHB-68]